MNPRERVMIALNHQEPDKVPIDLNATLVTALTRTAYDALRDFLSLEPDPDPNISSREMDTVRSLEDLLLLYEVDTRCIHMKAALLSKGQDMPDGTYYDDFGIRWKKAAYYYDAIERPLKDATVSDLAHAQWPDPYDPGRVAGLREEAKAAYENTPYCLVADIMCLGPFEGACFTRGYDQFPADLYLDRPFAEALLDKITETDIALWDVFLSEVGDYVQVVAQGDDLGMQKSPMISPEMYREFIKPRHKRMFDFIHSKTEAKIFLHSCGSVYNLIPDFIEIGVDILNPVQTGAAKMDLATLKREFGKDLTFWGGGIDIQQQLPFFTLDEIEDEIKRRLDIMAPGGGHVFFPTHNIQADVTPDRIHHMYKTVIEYRDYKNFSPAHASDSL